VCLLTLRERHIESCCGCTCGRQKVSSSSSSVAVGALVVDKMLAAATAVTAVAVWEGRMTVAVCARRAVEFVIRGHPATCVGGGVLWQAGPAVTAC
jgi:hypothetical protein